MTFNQVKNELLNDLKNRDYDKLNVLLGYKTVEEIDIDESLYKLENDIKDEKIEEMLNLYEQVINH